MNLRWIPGKFFWDSPDPKSRNWYWDNNETHRNFLWFRPENPKNIPKFWTGFRMIMNDLDMAMDQYPIHTIFSGMNIHFNPAILMWTTGVPGFWHTTLPEPMEISRARHFDKGRLSSTSWTCSHASKDEVRAGRAHSELRGLENQGILMDSSCVKPTKIALNGIYIYVIVCHSNIVRRTIFMWFGLV